jgi:hypothetical protein
MNLRYLKTFGLAAVAAMALMAFAGAGTASATEICTANSFPCPAGSQITELQLSKDPNTTPVLENTEGSIEDTCSGATAEGAVTQGSSTKTPRSLVLFFYFSCTNTTIVNNTVVCEVEFHGRSGSVNATVTTRGCTFTIVIFGVNCRYGGGAGITLGEFVGGTTKTIAVNTVVEGIDSNSFLCPVTLRWTGSYIVTNHTAVYFHV